MNLCQECIFKDRKKIPYELTNPCDILIVGEAPAEEEEALGKPFVGRSGKVLRRVIQYSGIGSKRISIANALKCRIFKDKDKTKDINSAMKLCKNYLEEAIEKIKPKIIVCLGAYALKQILNIQKVLENRGKVYNSKYGIPVYCTVHPSYILRGGATKDYPNKPYNKMSPREKMLFDDFMQLKKIIDNNYTNIEINTEKYREASLEDLKKIYQENKRFAVDLETSGLGYGNDREILAISFSVKEGESFIVTEFTNSKLKVINKILTDKDKIKIVANRPFDEIMWEKRFGVKWEGVIHDVLVLAHLINENLGEYTLENVVYTYTGLKNIKELAEGLRHDIKSMSKETLIRYNGVDTDGTLRAYNYLIKELKKNKKLTRYYTKFLLPVLDMFSSISKEGFYIDRELLEKKKKELVEITRNIHEEALDKVPFVLKVLNEKKGVKLSRSDFIRQILFTSKFGYKLKPKKFTSKTKLPATDEKHLKEFSDNPFVKHLLRWKKASKILTTYFKQLEENINKDGKIYPNTSFYHTVTGRTVVLNPAIQTFPQRGEFAPYIKEVFRAPKGFLLCSRDLAQSELRIIGWLAKDKNILDALKKGVDLHTKTAALVNKIPIDKVEKSMRQKAKAINFGFVYGMSAESFVTYAKDEYGQIFSLEEAQEIRRDFFAYPRGYYALPKYHNKMISMANKYEYVVSPLGRIRRLPAIHSEDKRLVSEAKRQAINFPVQSFSSDLALIGMMLFYKWIDEELLSDKILPLWFIHDAVLFLAKEDLWEDAQRKLKSIYLEDVPAYIKLHFGLDITYPVESDGKVGPSWADMEELEW